MVKVFIIITTEYYQSMKIVHLHSHVCLLFHAYDFHLIFREASTYTHEVELYDFQSNKWETLMELSFS